MGVVSFMPLPLYTQGKSPWYPLDRGVGDCVINEFVAVGEMRIGNRNSKNVEKTCPRIILTAINST
jgi:hypothetical protein